MMTVWFVILKNDDSMVSYTNDDDRIKVILKNDDSMVSFTKER